MKLFRAFLVAMVITAAAFAESLPSSYPVGEGSKFVLSLPEGVEAELMIYVAAVDERTVNVETFFSAGSSLELWQQTRFEPNGSGSITPKEAYLFTSGMKAPEKFNPLEVLPQDGMQWADFLFPKLNSTGAKQIVKTEAGDVPCDHHMFKAGNQTFEFWVSEQARPIGLVKLVAGGKQPFDVKLKSLVKNVQRKIDPRSAVPLTATGRALLPTKQGMPALP